MNGTRYLKTEKIGRGGSSEVFRVVSPDRQVSLFCSGLGRFLFEFVSVLVSVLYVYMRFFRFLFCFLCFYSVFIRISEDGEYLIGRGGSSEIFRRSRLASDVFVGIAVSVLVRFFTL